MWSDASFALGIRYYVRFKYLVAKNEGVPSLSERGSGSRGTLGGRDAPVERMTSEGKEGGTVHYRCINKISMLPGNTKQVGKCFS